MIIYPLNVVDNTTLEKGSMKKNRLR